MKFKELTITDIISVLTILAVSICLITKAYFYARLDAVWILSLISPSIYFFDIIKVLNLMIFSIISIKLLEMYFLKLTKKKRLKKKIKCIDGEDLRKILTDNRKKYERNFLIFICIFILIISLLLPLLGFKTSFLVAVLSGGMIGIVFVLLTDKALDRTLKFMILGFIVFVGSMITGELKYKSLDKLPIVTLSSDFDQKQTYQLLELSKTSAVLMLRDKNGTNRFKIVDLNQIDTIFESE